MYKIFFMETWTWVQNPEVKPELELRDMSLGGCAPLAYIDVNPLIKG